MTETTDNGRAERELVQLRGQFIILLPEQGMGTSKFLSVLKVKLVSSKYVRSGQTAG